jgi:hypothetical protein
MWRQDATTTAANMAGYSFLVSKQLSKYLSDFTNGNFLIF